MKLIFFIFIFFESSESSRIETDILNLDTRNSSWKQFTIMINELRVWILRKRYLAAFEYLQRETELGNKRMNLETCTWTRFNIWLYSCDSSCIFLSYFDCIQVNALIHNFFPSSNIPNRITLYIFHHITVFHYAKHIIKLIFSIFNWFPTKLWYFQVRTITYIAIVVWKSDQKPRKIQFETVYIAKCMVKIHSARYRNTCVSTLHDF